MVTSLLSIKLRLKAETSACHVITNSQSFNRWMRSRINHWMRRSLVRCRVILMSIAKSLQKAQLMSKAHPIALPQLFALLPRLPSFLTQQASTIISPPPPYASSASVAPVLLIFPGCLEKRKPWAPNSHPSPPW